MVCVKSRPPQSADRPIVISTADAASDTLAADDDDYFSGIRDDILGVQDEVVVTSFQIREKLIENMNRSMSGKHYSYAGKSP